MWIKQTKMVINSSFLKPWPQPDTPLNKSCDTALYPCIIVTHWSQFLFTIKAHRFAYIPSLIYPHPTLRQSIDCTKEVGVATLTSPIGLRTTVSKP